MGKAKGKAAGSTALARYDEELARRAGVSAKQESTGLGAARFSTRSGILKFNDLAMPGNQMAVFILDALIEKRFYGSKFDPEKPESPLCYALGRDETRLAPHETAIKKQAENCGICPNNAFGSAGGGRKGKACGTIRRLALIPAGSLAGGKPKIVDAEAAKASGIAFLSIPVTSVRGYAAYVSQLANVEKLPPLAVVTRIFLTPDAKNQFYVNFEMLERAPSALLPVLLERADEAAKAIEFPYLASPEAAQDRAFRKERAASKAKRRKFSS